MEKTVAKKVALKSIIVCGVVVVGSFLVGCGSASTDSSPTANVDGERVSDIPERPEGRPTYNGTIKKMIGNEAEITYKDMSGVENDFSGLTPEERTERFEGLSDEERTNMFQEMRTATENAPDISETILIPAGIPIIVTEGRGFGGRGGGAGRGGVGRGGNNGLGGVLNTDNDRPEPIPPKLGTMNDVSEGSTVGLRTTTTEDGRIIAEYVTVQVGGAAGFGGAGGGQGGGGRGGPR